MFQQQVGRAISTGRIRWAPAATAGQAGKQARAQNDGQTGQDMTGQAGQADNRTQRLTNIQTSSQPDRRADGFSKQVDTSDNPAEGQPCNHADRETQKQKRRRTRKQPSI